MRVPEAGGSRILPLDVQRRSVGTRAGDRARDPAGHDRAACSVRRRVRSRDVRQPVRALPRLVWARLAADLVVRLARRRRLYRHPPPVTAGCGRRDRKHGAALALKDPTTQGDPDRTLARADPTHGAVQVDAWEDVHVYAAPEPPLTLVRVAVERLPRHARAPEPLWLAWIGGPLPDDLLALWRWYGGRFTIEHGFRFLKHDLGLGRHPPARPRGGRPAGPGCSCSACGSSGSPARSPPTTASPGSARPRPSASPARNSARPLTRADCRAHDHAIPSPDDDPNAQPSPSTPGPNSATSTPRPLSGHPSLSKLQILVSERERREGSHSRSAHDDMTRVGYPRHQHAGQALAARLPGHQHLVAGYRSSAARNHRPSG